MHCELPIVSTTQTVLIEGLPIPQDDFENTDPPAFQAHEADLIMGMRDKLQDPPPAEFRMEDLVWTYHVTNGKCRQKGSRLVVIP